MFPICIEIACMNHQSSYALYLLRQATVLKIPGRYQPQIASEHYSLSEKCQLKKCFK